MISENEYMQLLQNYVAEYKFEESFRKKWEEENEDKVWENERVRVFAQEIFRSRGYLLEKIEDKFSDMPKGIKDVVAWYDLGFVIRTPINLANEQITGVFTKRRIDTLYPVAKEYYRLKDISDDAWDNRITFSGKGVDDLRAQLKRFKKEEKNYFRDYGRIVFIIEALRDYSLEGEKTELPQADTKKLDELFDGFRKYQLTDAGDRKKIYEYWAGTDSTFKSFKDIVIEVPLLQKLQKLTGNEMGQSSEGDAGMREFLESIDAEEGYSAEVLKYKRALDKILKLRIPKYTITYPTAPTLNQYSQEVSLVKLAGDLVYQITRVDTEEYRKVFSRGISRDEVDIQEETDYDDNKNAIGTSSSIDYNEQVGEELLVDVEEIERMADPLSLLAARLNKSQLYVDDGLAQSVKEKVVEELSEYLNNPDILEMVRESYLDQIEEFISEIKSDLVKEGPYTFMILDDKKNSSILSKLKSGKEKYKFVLEYYIPVQQDNNIKMILKTQEKNSYEAYINSVNEMTNDLFDTIVEVKNIIPEARFNRNVARKPFSTKPGSARTASLSGGNYIPEPGEFAESLQEKDDLTYTFFEQLVSIFNQYYFDIIDTRYLFEMDKPNFIQSDSYKKIASLSTKTGTGVRAGIRRAMVKRSNINITAKDFTALNNFFTELKRYSQLSVNEAKNIFQEVTPVFRKLYLMDLPESDSRRKQITGVNKNLTNYMGKLLYEILVASQQINENDIDIPVEYEGKSLDEYKNSETDISQLKIFDVLEDEEFISYANDNKLYTPLRNLKRTLRRNPLKISRTLSDKDAMYKAYIEALDTVKSNRGEKIYKAYFDFDDVGDVEYVLDLIQNEDRIDLYARDIEGIIKSYDSFNTLSSYYGISDDIIYKVKGLFR